MEVDMELDTVTKEMKKARPALREVLRGLWFGPHVRSESAPHVRLLESMSLWTTTGILQLDIDINIKTRDQDSKIKIYHGELNYYAEIALSVVHIFRNVHSFRTDSAFEYCHGSRIEACFRGEKKIGVWCGCGAVRVMSFQLYITLILTLQIRYVQACSGMRLSLQRQAMQLCQAHIWTQV